MLHTTNKFNSHFVMHDQLSVTADCASEVLTGRPPPAVWSVSYAQNACSHFEWWHMRVPIRTPVFFLVPLTVFRILKCPCMHTQSRWLCLTYLTPHLMHMPMDGACLSNSPLTKARGQDHAGQSSLRQSHVSTYIRVICY